MTVSRELWRVRYSAEFEATVVLHDGQDLSEVLLCRSVPGQSARCVPASIRILSVVSESRGTTPDLRPSRDAASSD